MTSQSDYLIQDMQRVLKYYKENNCKLSNEIERLEKVIAIYEKALKIYGNPDNYGDRGEFWRIVVDGGELARKAIEGAKRYGEKEEK